MNAQFKQDMGNVLKKHGVHPALVSRMKQQGGFLDKLFKIVKTGVDVAKKGYDFYNDNKEAIHKGIGMGKSVLDKLRSKRGGELPSFMKTSIPVYRQPVRMVKGGKISGGKISGSGLRKSKKTTQMSSWIERVKAYQRQHPTLTYKQAMMELSKNK